VSAASTPGAPRAAAVRVPASTSNLGAGFDCVGVALDRWLRATATVGAQGGAEPRVARAGALAALGLLPPGDDLLVRGFAAACAAAGRAVPAGLVLAADSDVPVARGLGSSAAAIVAGALLADALLGLGLGPAGAAAVCADMEGHPDNAAPACLGGAVLGVPTGAAGGGAGAWTLAALDLHPAVGFAFAVPDFGASTAAMRRALPAALAYHDAVRAAGKAAALVRGLAAADPTLLAWALDDVLHVPYRRALLPGYDAVCAAATAAGAWGATISGAGSSLVALAPVGRAAAVADAMTAAWRSAGVAAEAWAPAVAGPAEVEVAEAPARRAGHAPTPTGSSRGARVVRYGVSHGAGADAAPAGGTPRSGSGAASAADGARVDR
jgi:homoserine kinase